MWLLGLNIGFSDFTSDSEKAISVKGWNFKIEWHRIKRELEEKEYDLQI